MVRAFIFFWAPPLNMALLASRLIRVGLSAPIRRGENRYNPWRVLLTAFILVLGFTSCKKKKAEEVPVPATLQHGILVLNEGLFNLNNSTLSWIDLSSGSVNNSFFEQKTGRGLGDTGNDMLRYGGKLYIIVNVSSTLEILDAHTCQPLQQISLISGNTPQQPRSIVAWQNKVLISCFDGYVSVVDTTSLSVQTRIQVGSNPEGLSVSGNKLFVANSGGLNQIMDSTVSIVDLTTMQEVQKIVVGLNPGGLCTDSEGDVYVITRGNYGSIPSRMHRIDPDNYALQHFAFDASGMTPMNNDFLISYYDFSTSSSSIGVFNTLSETLTNPNFIPTAGIQTLYGVDYSAATGKIYLTDAKGYTETGSLLVYSSSGILEQTYNVGLNPCKIIVYE